MRVTKENGYAYCRYDNTAVVFFDVQKWLWLGKELPRVVEYPKFWREGECQFKVKECGLGNNLFPGDFQLVRIPQGSEVTFFTSANIEKY